MGSLCLKIDAKALALRGCSFAGAQICSDPCDWIRLLQRLFLARKRQGSFQGGLGLSMRRR